MWGRRKQPSNESELPAEPKKRLVDVSSQRAPSAVPASTSLGGSAPPKPSAETKSAFPSAPSVSGSPLASASTAAPAPSTGSKLSSGTAGPSGAAEQSGVNVPSVSTAPAVERMVASKAPVAKPEAAAPSMTTIGEGMEIDGHLTTASDLDVFGVIEGDVESSGHVQVHPRAVIKGTISSQSVNVEGTVEGDVTTRGRLYIGAAGRVEGDVQVKSLNVEEGGSLLGRCMMT